MNNDNHPITPPPELVLQWSTSITCEQPVIDNWVTIATQAARWGADQELEACCELLKQKGVPAWSLLRLNRRPKPPSLKQQALAQCNDYIDPDGIIRRALEALPDD